MLLGHKTTPIGVDVGARWIKAAQLYRAHGAWHTQAALMLPRSAETEILEQAEVVRLHEAMLRQGFCGRQVVLAVPNSKLEVEMLELPPKNSGAPIEDIARTELARSARAGVKELETALWDVPAPARGGTGCAMMGAAVRLKDAEGILDAFESQGLSVRALDTQAWAMARACSAWKPSDQSQAADGIVAMMNLGWSGGLLALMHDGNVLYQRTVAEVGVGLLHRSVFDRFELSPEVTEHLLHEGSLDGATGADSVHASWVRTLLRRYADLVMEEVEAAVAYARHRYPQLAVNRLMLTGGGAEIGGFADWLTRRLDKPTSLVRPTDLATCREELMDRCATAALTIAIGLALHGS